MLAFNKHRSPAMVALADPVFTPLLEAFRIIIYGMRNVNPFSFGKKAVAADVPVRFGPAVLLFQLLKEAPEGIGTAVGMTGLLRLDHSLIVFSCQGQNNGQIHIGQSSFNGVAPFQNG